MTLSCLHYGSTFLQENEYAQLTIKISTRSVAIF